MSENLRFGKFVVGNLDAAIVFHAASSASPHAGKVVLVERGKPDEVIGSVGDFPLTVDWLNRPQ